MNVTKTSFCRVRDSKKEQNGSSCTNKMLPFSSVHPAVNHVPEDLLHTLLVRCKYLTCTLGSKLPASDPHLHLPSDSLGTLPGAMGNDLEAVVRMLAVPDMIKPERWEPAKDFSS